MFTCVPTKNIIRGIHMKIVSGLRYRGPRLQVNNRGLREKLRYNGFQRTKLVPGDSYVTMVRVTESHLRRINGPLTKNLRLAIKLVLTEFIWMKK